MIVPNPCPQRKVRIWELIWLRRGNRKYSEEELCNGKNYSLICVCSQFCTESDGRGICHRDMAEMTLMQKAQVSRQER